VSDKIKLPKHCVRDPGPDGKERIYVRMPGKKKILIANPMPWSPSFMAEYESATGNVLSAVVIVNPTAVRDRTFRWLCQQYMETSLEFLGLSENTAYVRKTLLDSVCKTTISSTSTRVAGDCPVEFITPKAIAAIRDRNRDAPTAANAKIKAIRLVFKWACDPTIGHCTINPARDVPLIKVFSDGHHTWTIEEVEQYERKHPVGTKPRLTMDLMLYTGQRISDAAVLGRQHEKDGWLKFTQQKNKKRKPVNLQIPIFPPLRDSIDASPVGDLTYIVADNAKPYTVKRLGEKVREWCDEAGLPHCSSHGLRKACASRLAELGASEKLIQSITGHTTSQEVQRYTKAANQKAMAGEAEKLMRKPR
jgi:integrase